MSNFNDVRFKWHVANELHEEDPDNFKPWNLYEMLRGLEFDHNAAEFIVEWYPEYEHAIRAIYETPFSFTVAAQMSDQEFGDFVDYYGSSEEYIAENYGSIFRDTAFNGVIYIGS